MLKHGPQPDEQLPADWISALEVERSVGLHGRETNVGI
jgi:hypothetical protein